MRGEEGGKPRQIKAKRCGAPKGGGEISGGAQANFVSIGSKNLLLTFWKVKHCKGGRGGGSMVGGPKAAKQ